MAGLSENRQFLESGLSWEEFEATQKALPEKIKTGVADIVSPQEKSKNRQFLESGKTWEEFEATPPTVFGKVKKAVSDIVSPPKKSVNRQFLESGKSWEEFQEPSLWEKTKTAVTQEPTAPIVSQPEPEPYQVATEAPTFEEFSQETGEAMQDLDKFGSRLKPAFRQSVGTLKKAYATTGVATVAAKEKQKKEDLRDLVSKISQYAGAKGFDQPTYENDLSMAINKAWNEERDASEVVYKAIEDLGIKRSLGAVDLTKPVEEMQAEGMSNFILDAANKAGTLQGYEKPVSTDPMFKALTKYKKKISKEMDQWYAANPEYKLPDDYYTLPEKERRGKYPQYFWGEAVFGNVLNSITAIGTFVGGTAVSGGNPAIGALATGVAMYPQFVGEVYDELDAMEQKEGIKVPDEIKAHFALVAGVPIGMTEGLGEYAAGFGKIFKPIRKKVTKEILKKTIIDQIRKNSITRAGAWTAKAGAGSGAEEAIQKVGANITAKIAGSQRPVTEGAKEAAIVGAPVGVALSAGPMAVQTGIQKLVTPTDTRIQEMEGVQPETPTEAPQEGVETQIEPETTPTIQEPEKAAKEPTRTLPTGAYEATTKVIPQEGAKPVYVTPETAGTIKELFPEALIDGEIIEAVQPEPTNTVPIEVITQAGAAPQIMNVDANIVDQTIEDIKEVSKGAVVTKIEPGKPIELKPVEALSKVVEKPKVEPAETIPAQKSTEETKKAPAELKIDRNALAKEAKKYKSADEFVESKEIFYHGTNKDFTGFNRKHKNTNPRFSDGFYFTGVKSVAEFYAKSKAEHGEGKEIVSQVYVDLKKPLEINNDAEYRKIISSEKNKGGRYERDQKLGKKDSELLEDMGYDGIIYKFKGKKQEAVAFHSEQIKTKAQLINIWNKAQQKKADPVETLTEKTKVETKEKKVKKPPLELKSEEIKGVMIEKAGKKVRASKELKKADDKVLSYRILKDCAL